MNRPSIYFDYAAATPVDDRVLAAMQPFFSEQFYNPSAIYLASRSVFDALEAARHDVAQTIGARPGEVVFTAGATEANNLAITGIMAQYPSASLLVSAVEHPSVLEPAKRYNHATIPVDGLGRVSVEDLAKRITDDVVLVSIMHANNEVGTLQPLREIADVVSKIREERQNRKVTLPLHLHTDAAQATNYMDIHVARLGVDMMTISAAKTYGPKQVGALYVKAGLRITPVITGGGQEHGMRSGTQNVAGAVGLAKALYLAQSRKKAEIERLKSLQGHFIDELQRIAPDVVIHGHLRHRLPNNIACSFPGVDGERAVMMLDERGIQAATGSACGASKDGPSHVLLALGVSPTLAESSLRFTMGRSTTKEHVDMVITALEEIIKTHD